MYAVGKAPSRFLNRKGSGQAPENSSSDAVNGQPLMVSWSRHSLLMDLEM